MYFKMSFKIVDGKIKHLKHTVMRSYLLFATNAYVNDANFNYTECTGQIIKGVL